MNVRGTARRLAVGLASLALLAACGAGANPTPVPATPTPIVTPSAAVATPTLAPTPTASTAGPMTYGPVTVVTGTATCPTADFGTPTTDADGVHHYRDMLWKCEVRTDDPRVTGTEAAPWNMDLWGTTDDGALVQWGTSRLENDGGAWEGTGSGVWSSDRGDDTIAFWYKGTGGYAGLSYFELWTGQEPWRIQGQVFPGDPPPPDAEGGTTITRPEASGPVADDAVAVVSGTAKCPGLDFAFTTDPDGTKHVRDDYHADRCTVTTDDPRVSGNRTSTWNIDLWGTVNAGRWKLVQWGTVRLENEAGAWEGRATGVASSSHGDIIVNWYKGTGDYAGLGYFELWTGSGPWKIQGQVFPGDPPMP